MYCLDFYVCSCSFVCFSNLRPLGSSTMKTIFKQSMNFSIIFYLRSLKLRSRCNKYFYPENCFQIRNCLPICFPSSTLAIARNIFHESCNNFLCLAYRVYIQCSDESETFPFRIYRALPWHSKDIGKMIVVVQNWKYACFMAIKKRAFKIYRSTSSNFMAKTIFVLLCCDKKSFTAFSSPRASQENGKEIIRICANRIKIFIVNWILMRFSWV